MIEIPSQTQFNSNYPMPAESEDSVDEAEMRSLKLYCNVLAGFCHGNTGFPRGAINVQEPTGRQVPVYVYGRYENDAIDVTSRLPPVSMSQRFEASVGCRETGVSGRDLDLICRDRQKMNVDSVYYQTAERLAIQLALDLVLLPREHCLAPNPGIDCRKLEFVQ